MKLYLVVRADLSPAQQAVQASHALRQFVDEHPQEDQEWFEKSNTIAFLAVGNEQELTQLLARAELCGISCSGFREPDRGDELTAAAISPQGKRLCRGLPLALAEGSVRALICTPTTVEKTSSVGSGTISGACLPTR